MEYRIYGTRIRFDLKFSSPLISLPSLLVLTILITLPVLPVLAVSTTSLLVLVTDVEIAKTNTSFLLSVDTWWHNVPSGNSGNT